MPNSTTNYAFNLPLVNDAIDADLWGGQLNANWTSLDGLLQAAGIRTGGGLITADDKFRVVGSADATKQLALEIDGFTTGTTRTLTFQDKSGIVPLIENANISIPATAAGPSSLTLAEDTDNGSNTVTIISPSALGANVTTTLPSTTGTLANRSKYAYLTHEVSAGSGGGTAVQNTWTNRPLNTEVDTDGIVALSSNTFTVATTGDYKVSAFSQHYSDNTRVGIVKTRLRDTTGGVTVLRSLTGGLGFPSGTSGNVPVVIPDTVVTLTAGNVYALQYYCGYTGSSNDLGSAYGSSGSGEAEVYAKVSLELLT